MLKALNPKYAPPSRDQLTNTLIDAWYSVEKDNVLSELKHVRKAAITSDGWTSITRGSFSCKRTVRSWTPALRQPKCDLTEQVFFTRKQTAYLIIVMCNHYNKAAFV